MNALGQAGRCTGLTVLQLECRNTIVEGHIAVLAADVLVIHGHREGERLILVLCQNTAHGLGHDQAALDLGVDKCRLRGAVLADLTFRIGGGCYKVIFCNIFLFDFVPDCSRQA